MNRLEAEHGVLGASVPRASGDEPYVADLAYQAGMCSPRQRG